MVHNPGMYFHDTLSGALPARNGAASARNFCLLPPPVSVNPVPASGWEMRRVKGLA
jgi:hypothetical protein